MEPQGLLAQLVEQFPSPIGELHFSIMCCDYSINYQTRFRPLSGNYISQLNRATLTGFVTEFPSPVGELHFSILISYAYECNIRCFRPLSGNYISQLRRTTMTRKHMSAKFPSPVGELHFSMVARNSPSPNIQFPSPVGELHFSIRSGKSQEMITGFRPLSGNYISQ